MTQLGTAYLMGGFFFLFFVFWESVVIRNIRFSLHVIFLIPKFYQYSTVAGRSFKKNFRTSQRSPIKQILPFITKLLFLFSL